MRKPFKCKLGFHDWHEIKSETYGIALIEPIHLVHKVCLRPGCGKEINEFEEFEEFVKEQKARRDKAQKLIE